MAVGAAAAATAVRGRRTTRSVSGEGMVGRMDRQATLIQFTNNQQQLQALSARLHGKEAELAAAQQTIDLLVSSVRSLEASMSRLVGGTNGNGKQQRRLSPHHGGNDGGGGNGGGTKSLSVRVEEEGVVSAKSEFALLF